MQKITKGSLLLDLSLASLGPKAKAHIDSGNKQGSLELNDSLFVKGKSVIGRNWANKAFFKATFDAVTPLSSPKAQYPFTHGDDKSEQRTPHKFQLSTSHWLRWAINLEGMVVEIPEVVIAEIQANPTHVMGWFNDKL